MTAALVPVKQLTAGKSRLAAALGRPSAERLALAMLEDVVRALRAVPRLDPVAVVTPDAEVARAAEAAGARALLRSDPGLNASLDAAARELAAGGDDALLVVLGDVAGAQPEDLETLLDALPGVPGAALAAARDGGTTALVRAPWNALPSCFGPDSAAVHQTAAERAGVPLVTLELPSLRIDLDSESDLKDFLARANGGERTRRLLRELGHA